MPPLCKIVMFLSHLGFCLVLSCGFCLPVFVVAFAVFPLPAKVLFLGCLFHCLASGGEGR